jgi:hypothetical protein
VRRMPRPGFHSPRHAIIIINSCSRSRTRHENVTHTP